MTGGGPIRGARRDRGIDALGPAAVRPRPDRIVRRERRASATRAERWLSAVGTRPLERPVPFPTWARPLVRAIAGSSRTPRVAFGAATRSALGAAGATAAAWDGVVRLPRSPRETPEDVETIAHELSHTVTGGPRPSFFEGATADPGETRARAFGRSVRRIAASLGTSSGLARRTASVLGGTSHSDGAPARAGAPAVAGGFMQQAAAAPRVPDVRSLPVAGAVARVAPAPVAATGAAAATGGFPAAGLPGLDPSSAVAPARSAAAQEVSSVTRGATSAAADLAGRATGAGAAALDRAQSAAARAAGEDVLGTLGAVAAGARDSGSQLGYLLEALEERVVAELERRGGRYAGAF